MKRIRIRLYRLLLVLAINSCTKAVKYYDRNRQTCDPKKYQCIDVNGVK